MSVPPDLDAAVTRPNIATQILLCCCLAFATGCVPVEQPIRLIPPKGLTEVPAANLPVSLRPHNWVDSRGSGSCVHASTVYNLQWAHRPEMADWWRRNHAGGETSTTIRRYLDRAGLKYYFTLNADPTLLDWATATRRSCVIWFFTAHAINFVGFHRGPDGIVYAHLVDNNRPTEVIRIERQSFLKRWAGYGGFAVALADPPSPPPLYDAIVRIQ